MGTPTVQGRCIKCDGPATVKAWFAKAY
jgi:hypothetical protein